MELRFVCRKEANSAALANALGLLGNGVAFIPNLVSKAIVFAQFALGPFVMLSIAQYSNSEARIGGQTASQSISNKAMHEWLGFGIRGKFDL
jgi:hypothetical protein